MLKEYEINSSTIAILSLRNGYSRVIEEDEEFVVKKDSTTIINDSCKFFGSSYVGRFEGTKNLIGISYKAPIIVEETQELIFFPTSSPRFDNCNWLCLSKIESIKKYYNQTAIYFKNGERIEIPVSYHSIENQILRSTLLEAKMRERKKLSIK